MSFLLPTEAAALDVYWEQLLRIPSGRDHAFQWKLSQILESGGSNATQAAVTLWVDSVNGSDSNPGSQTAPFASIQRALDQIPLIVRHSVTINVRAGTYAESVQDNHIYALSGALAGGITIFGFDLNTAPVITGSLTGTLGTAPSTGATWSATISSNWTAHALKGMFIQITSGSDNGKLYPIADNATNTLDLPTWRTQLNGATFAIVQNAATVTRVNSSAFASFVLANQGDAGTCLTVQRLNLVVQSSAFYAIYQEMGFAVFTECSLDASAATSGFGVNMFGPKCSLSLSRTYVKPGSSGFGIAGNNIGTLVYGAVVVDGGGSGVVLESCNWLGNSSSGGLICQGQSTVGVKMIAGPLYASILSGGRILCRNGAIGARFEGPGGGFWSNCEFTGNSSHGVQVWASDINQGALHIQFLNPQITGNGGDGVRVETPHNGILFSGTGNISSNTGVGVNFISLAGGLPSSHNSAYFATGITMSGNGNDMSIDGTNFSSIATLRAASGKFITDSSSLFNRLSAQ